MECLCATRIDVDMPRATRQVQVGAGPPTEYTIQCNSVHLALRVFCRALCFYSVESSTGCVDISTAIDSSADILSHVRVVGSAV